MELPSKAELRDGWRGAERQEFYEALRAIGLWDAKVWELESGYGDCGEHIWVDDDCNQWLVGVGWEKDQRVRVIVVPVEGDDGNA